MAISFVAAGAVAADTNGGAGTTPTLPSGIQLDDILVAIVCDSSQGAPASPAGWTGNNVANSGGWVYWRRATSSETNPHFSGGGYQKSVILAYRGCVRTGDPFDVTGTKAQATVPGTVTVASITTAADSFVTLASTGLNGSLSVASTAAPTSVVNSLIDSTTICIVINVASAPNGGGATSASSATLGTGGTLVDALHFSLKYQGPAPVTGVTVPSTANVGIGTSQPLIASVVPYWADTQTVTWAITEAASGSLDSSSANPVTYTAPSSMGAYPATVHVVVTTTDGSFTGTCTVTIPNPVSGSGPWPGVLAGRFDVVDAI